MSLRTKEAVAMPLWMDMYAWRIGLSPCLESGHCRECSGGDYRPGKLQAADRPIISSIRRAVRVALVYLACSIAHKLVVWEEEQRSRNRLLARSSSTKRLARRSRFWYYALRPGDDRSDG